MAKIINEDFQKKWEERSTVRNSPRLIIDPSEGGYFYPIERQPLCLHPKIEALGEKAINYLLLQSLYKYTNDIELIETKIVNPVALNITLNSYEVKFNEHYRLGALTLLTDESYHAYVAIDAMMQIQKETGINPLPLPETIEIEKAIKMIKNKLNKKYYSSFDLVAVSIAESTLTHEIISMIAEEETNPFFQNMLENHLLDESRHCGYFYEVLSYFWRNLDKDHKEKIGEVLAEFIELYLGIDIEIEFSSRVLKELGLTDSEISQIMHDTYSGFKVTINHPLLKNIMKQLTRCGVLDNFTLSEFKKRNWISE